LLRVQDKRAISEIVSYAILIIIAVSLSIMVYSFLKLYIPKDKVTCEEDLKLIFQDYTCQNNLLNLTITNKGLFKADAAYLRMGNASGKQQINKNNFLLYGLNNSLGLNPGDSFSSTYNIAEFLAYGVSDYSLELQPAIIRNKQIIVCENAIITQAIQCT